MPRRQAEIPSGRTLDSAAWDSWAAAELEQRVHPPAGFDEHYARLRSYVGYTVALLRSRPLQTQWPVPRFT